MLKEKNKLDWFCRFLGFDLPSSPSNCVLFAIDPQVTKGKDGWIAAVVAWTLHKTTNAF